jgi:hypothetical protein
MLVLPLSTPAISRRALSAALLGPIVGCALPNNGDPEMNSNDVDVLIERARTANDAFIGGDMRHWHSLVSPIGADFTLMSPFGGAPSHGFDGSDAHLAAMASRFNGGAASFELVESYATAEMVVLAFIERQRAHVGGLPDQDWSLRVTQVWMQRAGDWQLVHRHADPLTHSRNISQTAEIARGS